MGPSLFTMPQFVEELFSISNKNSTDYFSYKKKETVPVIIFIKMELFLKLPLIPIHFLQMLLTFLMLKKTP